MLGSQVNGSLAALGENLIGPDEESVSVGMAENTLLHDTLLEYIHDNSRFTGSLLTYNNCRGYTREVCHGVMYSLPSRQRGYHPGWSEDATCH
jgi:hypothetical protein